MESKDPSVLDPHKGDAESMKMAEATPTHRVMPELLQGLTQDELDALEKKLLRKVDLRLLPTMIIIYIMNYLDRLAT